MKKTTGVILLVIGILSILFGATIINDINIRNNSFGGRLQSTFSSNYRVENNNEESKGGAFIIVGIIVSILGIAKIASKSSSSKQSNNSKISEDNLKDETTVLYLTNKAEKLYESKDYITAIEVLKKIISIDPTHKEVYFNLACLFSLTKNEEAFDALSKAVKYGYSNFDRIDTYSNLSWIRSNSNFQKFKLNGYKFLAEQFEQTNSNDNSSITEDIISKIERLGQLKEKGLITEEEFQNQKKKLL